MNLIFATEEGWTVVRTEDEENIQWFVIDSDDHECDWFATEEAAIACCIEQSRIRECERLADEISDVVRAFEGTIADVDILRKIVKLLGI